jgi:hypothetical protein
MQVLFPFLSSPLLPISTENIVRIAVYVVILLVVWMVIRTIMRVTFRLFAFGCGAILVLGFILIAMRYFQR